METRLEAPFADGEYSFWLPLPQVFELERACGSLIAIEERLRAGIGIDDAGKPVFIGGGEAGTKEIIETIRVGLIGGNRGLVNGEEREIGPLEAKRLVENYAYPARPLVESAVLAWQIVNAALRGIQLKKKADPPSGEPQSPSRKDA